MAIPYDKKTPHRFDVVGSFLRPLYLKELRTDYKAGKVNYNMLKMAEDEAIRDLIFKQRKAGLGVITDGEFRRETWHLDFMWAFEGVGHSPAKFGLPFHDEEAMLDDTFLTGKVSLVKDHPFVEHFKYVKSFEDANTVAKLTIPAPAQFLEQMIMPFAIENTRKFYPDNAELADDIVEGYLTFIHQVYDAGCRNLQFDDCSWGMLVDPSAMKIFNVDAAGLEEIKESFLDINNRVIDGVPRAMTINTHVCRGNFHSTWASSGAYDSVASYLFAREKVDAFFLEFDDERSGGFEPLANIPEGKKVVLGLITTKRPELEDKEEIKARIMEAAKYVPLENLCLSPQCGFASCEIGNKLTEEEQWAKIALVKEIAEEVWG